MDMFLQNLRYAGRRLIKSPGFTITAILSLALGVGANTAIFSLVNAALLRELPLEAPEELVEVYKDIEGFEFAPLSYPDLEDMVLETPEVFTGVVASGVTFVQVDTDESVELLSGELVNGDYFRILGVDAALGRTFQPEDDVADGAHSVVMLSHGYWQRVYGGDPGIIGREIRLGGIPFTVIGVAPEAYTGNFRGLAPEVYVPIRMDHRINPSISNRLESRGSHWIFVKARLRPGVHIEQAETVLSNLAAELKERHPEEWPGDCSLHLVPTNDVAFINPLFDRFVVPAAGLLMGVVGLVLLIACANLASFLLAQAADRKKEIAVRLAIGATRRGLIGQLLTETVLLSLLGGAIGVALSVGLLHLLTSADLPLPLPISLDLSPDFSVLGFSVLLSLAAGVLFGLAPAIQGTRPELAPTLKDEGTGSGGPRRRLTLRRVLVSSQVAVCILLLVGAGLTLRSLAARHSVDPGFGNRPTGVLQVMLPSTKYSEEAGRLFLQALSRRIAEIPGVSSVGLIDNLHLNLLNTQGITLNVDGVEPPEGRDFHTADYAEIDPGFLEAAGIRLLSGRNFSDVDHADAPSVTIVSQALADRFFPGQDPLGGILHSEGDEDLLIVGVAADAKVRTLGENPRPFVYVPFGQSYSATVTLIAATEADAGRTAIDMVQAARGFDPDIRVLESKTMVRHLAVMLFPAKVSAFLLSLFAALALSLASIGIYGMVSYAVAQRTREVGIRVSLGATTRDVIAMLITGSLRLVAIGGTIGLVLALLTSRVLSRFLYGIGAVDPVTFVAVPLVLGLVALVAAYIPARRASRVSPVVALKQ